jgi:hypothetical protein
MDLLGVFLGVKLFKYDDLVEEGLEIKTRSMGHVSQKQQVIVSKIQTQRKHGP